MDTNKAINKLFNALMAYTYNPHCATTISEGKHSLGFCRICADQYFAANDALTMAEKLTPETEQMISEFLKDKKNAT
jgi:hypothetical protein